MALIDQHNLAADPTFSQRVQAAVVAYLVGTVLAEVTNDQQTVSVSGGPTGGSFTLANGPLTGAVAPAWNATAGVLQAALQAQLATGNTCVCTGGPLPGTPVLVTWTGGLANTPQNVLSVSANNLTGGSTPTPSVAHTTTGVSAVNHTARASRALVILGQIGAQQSLGVYQSQFAAVVAADATVLADYTGGGLNQTSVTDAHITAAVAAKYNAFLGL